MINLGTDRLTFKDHRALRQRCATRDLNTSSLAMTERPRELGDFKEVGQFEAKF